MGAQGAQFGTAFMATVESFAHEYHKQRIVDAGGEDTVLTDIFVLNWPAQAAVRVIGNSVTAPLGFGLLGHDPDALPREVIAHEDGAPRLRFATDSPLRNTTGNLEAMALYAGQGLGSITDIPTAAQRLNQIATEAEACLARLKETEK